MDVAAIMPCRGRVAQTVANVRRLLATANYNDASLICVSDGDLVVHAALQFSDVADRCNPIYTSGPKGYWRVLASVQAPYDLLINLANDLWACDDWLRIAVEDYQERFGAGDGLLGFAGDGHPPQHSCHFLISRGLLDRYGGWPTQYTHNFGDTELCQRAQADGAYAKSERAYLEHCHPMLGQGRDDEVYRAGRATFQQDRALFVERRRLGWPKVTGSASSGASISSTAESENAM